jgi:hypothetical protein
MHRGLFRLANLALAPLLALCSWISLNPYFLWDYHRHMSVAGMVAGLLAVIAFAVGDRPRRKEALGFLLIAVFVFYISMLPKTDGTLTRWYFVLPTMLALAIFNDDRRQQVLKYFSWIFALSLVPGIVVSLLTIANYQIDFGRLASANPVMAAGRGYYLEAPGALLLGSNSISLPWGGFLFRLCAMYDEPGMVGTIGVLLLAANRFKLNSIVFFTIFVGGILSCSLAFCMLAVLGFGISAVLNRSPFSLVPCAIAGLLGMMVIGIFSIEPVPKFPFPDNIARVHYAVLEGDTDPAASPAEVVEPSNSDVTQSPVAPAPQTSDATAVSPLPVPDAVASEPVIVAQPDSSKVAAKPPTLRQTEYINNRSLPGMDRLVAEYWGGGIKTILLGVSSDASVVRGGVSQVVTRLLTDFGLIGTLLFTISLISLAYTIIKNADSKTWAALFFVLFALSIYQRPIIWMPYAFTFFICGSIYAGRKPADRAGSSSNLVMQS